MLEIQLRENLRVTLRELSPRLSESLTRSMLQIVTYLQSYIITQKLRAGTPLHQRKGNLARAINTRVEQGSRGVTGYVGVGPQAPYGFVHEYGGVFTIREHMSRSRLGRTFPVRAHSATYPMRSFMRTALAENSERIQSLIQQAVGEALQR